MSQVTESSSHYYGALTKCYETEESIKLLKRRMEHYSSVTSSYDILGTVGLHLSSVLIKGESYICNIFEHT